MSSIMDKEALFKLANQMIEKDGRVKILSLSDELTISQVVKFFDRQGKNFTKTMIQNYVRVGVLPPPLDKRYYTKNHLILLTLIDSLKTVYSLEEIKKILAPIRNNPDIFEDDLIKTTDLYDNYLTIRKNALTRWMESLPQLFEDIDILLKKDGVEGTQRSDALTFMVTLAIMAETVAKKDLIQEILNEYVE